MSLLLLLPNKPPSTVLTDLRNRIRGIMFILPSKPPRSPIRHPLSNGVDRAKKGYGSNGLIGNQGCILTAALPLHRRRRWELGARPLHLLPSDR